MGKGKYEFYWSSPMPATLDDAKGEIARLRQQLHQQNLKMEALFVKKEAIKRSLLGSIKAMERRFGIRIIVDGSQDANTFQILTEQDGIVKTITVGTKTEEAANVPVENGQG